MLVLSLSESQVVSNTLMTARLMFFTSVMVY